MIVNKLRNQSNWKETTIMSAKDEEPISADTSKKKDAGSAHVAKETEPTAAETAKDSCCGGDGTTWTNAADKAQDELDETGTVNEAESDSMKKHSAG
jgi:hypothetical protein